MSRKKKHEDHVNHEAWAIPYADLLTLLLAFFVVMYAISSINEGKYRVMADALTTAFGGMPRTIKQVQVGNEQRTGSLNDTASAITSPALSGATGQDASQLSSMSAAMRRPINLQDQAAIEQATRQLNSISERISRALAPLIDRGMISVRRTSLWIEVEINSDILFTTASASLSPPARETLSTLAEVLREVPNTLRVEGHTDNMPIATYQFPSNWELSAARAASVVHLFADNGISPDRLAMVGYGEFRPREDNSDADGRNRNRRVMVVILADSVKELDPLSQHMMAGETDSADQAPVHPDAADPVTPRSLKPASAGHQAGGSP